MSELGDIRARYHASRCGLIVAFGKLVHVLGDLVDGSRSFRVAGGIALAGSRPIVRPRQGPFRVCRQPGFRGWRLNELLRRVAALALPGSPVPSFGEFGAGLLTGNPLEAWTLPVSGFL